MVTCSGFLWLEITFHTGWPVYRIIYSEVDRDVIPDSSFPYYPYGTDRMVEKLYYPHGGEPVARGGSNHR